MSKVFLIKGTKSVYSEVSRESELKVTLIGSGLVISNILLPPLFPSVVSILSTLSISW